VAVGRGRLTVLDVSRLARVGEGSWRPHLPGAV